MAEIGAANGTDNFSRVGEFPVPLLRASPDGHLLYANAQGTSLTKRARVKLGDLVPKEWREPLARFGEEANPVSLDWTLAGKHYVLKFVKTPNAFYVSIFARDTSDDYREEYRGPLTGLADRGFFFDRLQWVVSQSFKNKNRVAVHVMKLQNFENFSQTLGHSTCGAYLCKLAELLVRAVRTSDTIARIGYDEFALIQVEPNDQDGVETIVKKLKTVLS